MKYNYPLKLRFRLIALAPRIDVQDANEQEIFYIEQKLFALKEAVKVYDNAKDKNLLYTIKADRIIDFSAKYLFHTANQQEVGSIQQNGMRSLFQSSFDVFDKHGKQIYKIVQSNPWIAVLDSLISMIPFADLITGFVLHSTYTISEKENTDPIMMMKKKPSLFESRFEISLLNENISDEQELIFLLSFLMIVQLERDRG